MNADRTVRQSGRTMTPRDLAREHGAHRAMHVADRQPEFHHRFVFDRFLGQVQELVIERLHQTVILRDRAPAADALGHFGIVEHGLEVQPLGLPMVDRTAHLQLVDVAHHIFQLPETQLGHKLAHFFGDKEEKVDDVLRRAIELGAQARILGGNAHRARIEMALAHHDAAHANERRGRESELFGAEQRGNRHIAARAELAVRLHHDPAAQVVHHQHLLCFSQAHLPRDAGVFERRDGRSAGTARVARDQHHIRMRLGDAGGHDSHAHFTYQLHADARLWVDVFEIVDQLRQIFDRVNIMVRGRGNQTYAGDRMAHARDDLIHLVTGQLAALAGLGPLRHFDLQFVGVDQIVGRDAEAARRHLLDGAAAQVSVGIALEALFVFAALAGVGPPAHAIHRDGDRFVRLLGDGAERHRARGKALDDFGGGFHFFERHRLGRKLEFHQAPQRAHLARLIVNRFAVLLERLETGCGGLLLGAHGMLELGDRGGVEQVILAPDSVLVAAAHGQLGVGIGEGAKRQVVLQLGFPRQLLQTHAFNARGRAGEILVHHLLGDADGLKDLRAAIALQRRDAHLGEHFQQALVDRFLVILQGRLEVHTVGQQSAALRIFERLNRQIRIHRAGAVADQQAEVMDLARFAGFHHQRHLRARAFADQVMMQRRKRQQRRDRRVILIHAPV